MQKIRTINILFLFSSHVWQGDTTIVSFARIATRKTIAPFSPRQEANVTAPKKLAYISFLGEEETQCLVYSFHTHQPSRIPFFLLLVCVSCLVACSSNGPTNCAKKTKTEALSLENEKQMAN